jgi:ribonuclease HI
MNLNSKPFRGICSDAAYSTVTNIVSYRLFDIEENREIVTRHFADFKSQYLTNIGEFFGLVRAIKYVVDNDLDLPVYSDSQTAISWVLNKMVNTFITEGEVLKLVGSGEKYLKGLEKMPLICKWKTRDWGEIPADFGNKKGNSGRNRTKQRFNKKSK